MPKRSFYETQIKFGRKPDTVNQSLTIGASKDPDIAATGHGLETGDVIYIEGASHPAANGFFTVKTRSSTNFTLVGQDFTGAGRISGARYAKVTMTGFCDATSIDVEPAGVSFTDVTTNCDNYPQEEGELEAGSASMELYYDPESRVQQMLENAMFSQETLYMQTKPKGVNIVRGFACSVENWKYRGKVKDKYTANVGFKLKSRPHDATLS
ncbi:hypothetical protein LNQ82_03715 [Conchiformibius steedae DSM 2580]|uniref:Phage tail protein n=1 Tax=Conchiformibius steedae DSM 2580 TaxID=1121352 RepID=A0AAE9HX59_9NEIS|nr:hypothetical protein [Conchiformibius steedae]QMT33618.1 hypothetical protein H3L98_00790 [Conchiformibius steedae]URD68276.1 hypothetical protein LNQ82_03715 [Conchiformibius steedae DSM 2580]